MVCLFCWLFVFGCWLLVAGVWLLAFGCCVLFLLVVGCRLVGFMLYVVRCRLSVDLVWLVVRCLLLCVLFATCCVLRARYLGDRCLSFVVYC